VGMVTWSGSADKHGIPHEDALHAMTHPYYVEPEFDAPRRPGSLRPTLFIGPPRQLGGPLIEVMVEAVPPRTVHVFHVMLARRKFLDRMENDQ